jgi:hypothetical protein
LTLWRSEEALAEEIAASAALMVVVVVVDCNYDISLYICPAIGSLPINFLER